MALDAIRKKYQDAVVLASELMQQPHELHSLGPLSVTLLVAKNPHGIPAGKIIQLVGRYSSGKTTLALDMCRAFLTQYPDKYAAFVDVEYTFDPVYAQACGVDIKRLLVVQPSSAEQALMLVEEVIEQGTKFVVLDSVSALVPADEQEKTLEERPKVASVALLLTRFCARIARLLYRTQTTLVLINQMRKNITNAFGFDQEVPYGAAALHHASSLILSVRRTERNPTHLYTDVSVYKSKVGIPFGKASVPIQHGKGVDHALDTIQLALDAGLITKSGAWFYFQGDKFHGKNALFDPAVIERIREGVVSWYATKGDDYVAGAES